MYGRLSFIVQSNVRNDTTISEVMGIKKEPSTVATTSGSKYRFDK
jgi:hypothetical protein